MKPRRPHHSLPLVASVVCSIALVALPIASVAAPPANDPSLENELRSAVVEAVAPMVAGLERDYEKVAIEPGRRAPAHYANPWDVLVPGLFDFLDDDHEQRTYLVDVIATAARAWMGTLGEAAWQAERAGDFGYGDRLRPYDPGANGDGVIRIASLPGIEDLQIHFRASLGYRRGDTPAVVAAWVLQPEDDYEPLACRVLIPIDGLDSAFHRTLANREEGHEVESRRSYGLTPRLDPSGTVLQVWDGSEWVMAPPDWRDEGTETRAHRSRPALFDVERELRWIED